MLFLDLEVPGDVRDQILDQREGLHGLDGDRLIERQRVQARHAHELRHAVDFGRARAALAGLAVPAHREIVGLLGLDLMNGVEHHHAFGDLGGVVLELAAATCRRARFERLPSPSLHLLDDLLQLVASSAAAARASHLHLAIRAFADRRG